MQIVWTARALPDLAVLRAYISQERPVAGERQVELVLAAVAGLARFPHRGRPGGRGGTRELIVSETPYLVPYRVREASWRCCASSTDGSAGRTRSERCRSQIPAQRSRSLGSRASRKASPKRLKPKTVSAIA